MAQNRIREKIRWFARQDNRIGAVCSIALQLSRGQTEEARETWALHFSHDGSRMRISRRERRRQEQTVFSRPVLFSILVPLYNTPIPFLTEMVSSVRGQTYPKWELCLADGSDEEHGDVRQYCEEVAAADQRIRYRKLSENRGISGNTNACFEIAAGEYIVLFDHDDLLHPSALFECMKAIEKQGADYIYTDEVVFASPKVRKIISTHYKPDWAPDDLLTNNYICHLSVFRKELTEKAGVFRKEYDGSQDYDLILRLTDCAEKVVHIPKVLYFWRSHPRSTASGISSKGYAVDAGRRAVLDFLKDKKGIEAAVESVPECPTMYRIHYPIEGNPLVSVIVDCGEEPEQTETWMEQLCAGTGYVNTEYILVTRDGQEKTDGSFRTIRAAGTRRTERLNRAAETARGEYLLFLEEGLIPETADWIEELLMMARQKEIGAAGGVIVTPERRILQAGMILGLGPHRTAGRNYFNASAENSGYHGQMAVMENITAVGAECLMTARDLFFSGNGFNTDFEDALFDADLCLRYRQKGLRNIYTPYAMMQSERSIQTRTIEPGAKKENYGKDAAMFREKWQREIDAGDPYYNPHFSLRYVYIPRRKRKA